MTLTNIYLIENLDSLSCDYRLYKVRGLVPTSPEYEKNRQKLVDTLSRMTRSPCALYQSNGQLFIAQPIGYPDLPQEMQLIRAQAILEPVDGTRKLDFGKLTSDDIHLAIRFLKFSLEGPLFQLPMLWQPAAGLPFYHKMPDRGFAQYPSDAHLYRGFRFRLIILPHNRIGIAVDTSYKYVSRRYLPAKITEDYFRRIKGRNCMYEYGNRWYEIKIEGLEELTVNEIKLPNGRTLYEDVHHQGGGHKSHHLLSLPKDCSVLVYYTKFGEPRRVPSALCRLTYETNHPSVRKYHSKTIRQPHRRKQEIEFVVNKYLTGLKFNGTEIALGSPIRTKTKRFSVPDLLFGNDVVLTTNNGISGVFCPLSQLGNTKRKLLSSSTAGFYSKKSLDRQYFVIPQSVSDSYGEVFLTDLQTQFAELYGNNAGVSYEPTIIVYDDSVPHSIPSLGREILKAVESNFIFAGYALVMIPRLSYVGTKEDELANLVMRELRKRQMHASVIHTEVSSESYEQAITTNGKTSWFRSSVSHHTHTRNQNHFVIFRFN